MGTISSLSIVVFLQSRYTSQDIRPNPMAANHSSYPIIGDAHILYRCNSEFAFGCVLVFFSVVSKSPTYDSTRPGNGRQTREHLFREHSAWRGGTWALWKEVGKASEQKRVWLSGQELRGETQQHVDTRLIVERAIY